jgi:hypothetical protein
VPAQQPPALWIVSSTSLPLAGDLLRNVALPRDCVAPAPRPGDWLPCERFRFSPDGQWLAYDWGPEFDVRQLGITNVTTGAPVDTTGLSGLDRFLPGDQALAGISWGEGGEIWLLDLRTSAKSRLGPAGLNQWNADESALVVAASPYNGLDTGVWGLTGGPARSSPGTRFQSSRRPRRPR